MKNIMVTCLLGMMCFQQVQGQGTLLRYAAKQEEQLNYKLASEAYVEAFGRRAGYASAKGAAESFTKMNDYRSSFRWWKEVLTFKEEFTQQDVIAALKAGYVLGRQEEISGMLEGSGLSMEEFMDLANLVEGPQGEERYKLIYEERYNSEGADFMMAGDSQGNTYFVSDRSTTNEEVNVKKLRFDLSSRPASPSTYLWTGRDYLKIYKRASNGEISVLNIPEANIINLSDPWILEESGKKILLFSATIDNGKGKSEDLQPGLYYSKFDEQGDLGQVRPFGIDEPGVYGYISPFADTKNHLIYFASNRAGGFGGYDLYAMFYTIVGDELVFSDPENLGKEVNTPGTEKDPFVQQNQLFFSSDGHPRIGGMDIFQVEINKDRVVGKVKNMGTSINTVKDEFGYRKLGNGATYLSSNRLGDDGVDNIYRAYKIEKRIRVRIVDCYGGPLNKGVVSLIDPDGQIISMTQDSTGYFTAVMKKEGEYSVNVEKEGFMDLEEAGINTASLDSGEISKEYVMSMIRLNYADIIYYDLDKSQIKRREADILNTIALLMEEYPELRLRVSSYTDSRGTRSYNKRLSEKRAEAVQGFLETKNISGERITLKWYGEDGLVRDCAAADEVCHQLNRRSELLLYTADSVNENDCDYVKTMYSVLGSQFSEPVFNDKSQSKLSATQKMSLSRLIMIMEVNPGMVVEFKIGTSGGDLLFQQRAETVRRFMEDRGVDASRFFFSSDKTSEEAGEMTSAFEDGHHLTILIQ